MSPGLRTTLEKAAKHARGLGNMSRVVQRSIRYCLPGVNERFVPRGIDVIRKGGPFRINDFEWDAVERVAKAREMLFRGGYADHLTEHTNSDVVNECVRRFLVQHIDEWALTTVEDRAAIYLTAPVWPTLALMRPFNPTDLPADVFEMLRCFYRRRDEPSTLPEILRLVGQRLTKPSDGLPLRDIESVSIDEIVADVVKLLNENANIWNLKSAQ
jgi:hypothetical protein